MSASLLRRSVVIVAMPVPPPGPLAGVSSERLEQALLADATDHAESLALADLAVLCRPDHADSVAGAAAYDTAVWSSPLPTVREAAERAREAGAEQVVIVASDAPHLPSLLVGKVFRALARCDVAVCPDPRGPGTAVGLRLPSPEWVDELDLDRPDLADSVRARAPRRSLVRVTPGWRRLRDAADFATLDRAVEGADFTRSLLRR